MENALVHKVGDVATLQRHLSQLHDSPELLAKLRAGALRSRAEWTWTEAGRVLFGAYEQAIRNYGRAERNVVCSVSLGVAEARDKVSTTC
jgi:hypothetical protein